MPYQVSSKRNKRSTRKVINLHQKGFPKAYVSTIDNSRRPQDSVSDSTNMELVMDSIWRPRPPLVRYGLQPSLPVVGRGKYNYNGERGLLYMLNDGGVGRIYKQVDGGAFTLVSGSKTYDVSVWTMFCQSRGKVYPYNGIDKLTYLNLATNTIATYTALTTPTAPTTVASANLISGTTNKGTYYYRVSANNEVGESIASTVSTGLNVNTVRDGWSSETSIGKTVTITWTAVTNATSYTLYVGDDPLKLYELFSTTSLSYTDDGSLATNVFKMAPEGNSTEGFVPKWLYNDPKNSQMYGVSTGNKLYYSAPGSSTVSADFSPYNGGGWVTIDENGDTELNFVDGFRDGKGDPVITCSSRGAAGKGILSHVTFDDLTVGDQIITFPNVYPSSGQSATYAPRATFKIGNDLIYPTGTDFETTGTSQNIVNIITNKSLGRGIEPDLDKLNLAALSSKACGVEYKGRGYFALPVNSTENNEIWYVDRTRKDAWVLRWPIAAKDLWLYEDNAGATHFCALVNNVVLEFTRSGTQTHQDDGVAWRSRLAFESLVWDEDGIALGNVRNQYFKFLQPKGTIQVNATGLTRNGVSQTAGSDNFTVSTSFTGIGQWLYGDALNTANKAWKYGDNPGVVNTYGKSAVVLQIRPKGLLAQESWEIIGDTAGTDYIHAGTTTRGWYSEELILKV
jgi:hypothetical protein